MTGTRALRMVIIGLVGLLGLLSVVCLAIWLHYFIYGLLNPAKVRPLEDWYLGLGILSLVIEVVSIMVALALSGLIRGRWIPYGKGRIGVGLFSAIVLSQVLFGFWVADPSQSYGWLLWGFMMLAPVAFACFLIRHNPPSSSG
ncbi:MAG: hypothetical protein F6K42_09800 [Leptolyngbya sp. SIO1D8]|nr:hypothetical protein [Leptolyngbya sp. SIO1D8]